jgi:hypothetical protein
MGKEIHVHVTDHLGLHDEAGAEVQPGLGALEQSFAVTAVQGLCTLYQVVRIATEEYGFQGTADEAARILAASGRYTVEPHPATGEPLVRHRENANPVS